MPIEYYDNEDGFWNEYKDYKLERGYEKGIIQQRKYFIH